MSNATISRALAACIASGIALVGAIDITRLGWSYETIAPYGVILSVFAATWAWTVRKEEDL